MKLNFDIEVHGVEIITLFHYEHIKGRHFADYCSWKCLEERRWSDKTCIDYNIEQIKCQFNRLTRIFPLQFGNGNVCLIVIFNSNHTQGFKVSICCICNKSNCCKVL